jgi:hypothetical protein
MRHTDLTVAAFALVAALVESSAVQAVCLDPKTFVSNYHVPLADELTSSYSIIVGNVVKERRVVPKPAEPDFFVATIYTVHVVRTLKGQVAHTVTLRTENDSGRYPMSTGETHLLFLTKLESGLGADYYVDSCGSSTTLPKGIATLQEVEARLSGKGHAL